MIGERRKEKPEQEKKHLTYQLEKQLFFVNLRFLSQKLILSVQKKTCTMRHRSTGCCIKIGSIYEIKKLKSDL